jgi:2-methylaconitate cis-trans-isomerase PrpF
MSRFINFLLMRGGTSRGPFFKRADLPADLDTLTKVLLSVIGAGHPHNIDGIGGGIAVTTKVAMLSKSDDAWADIDYFFAQVAVDKCEVDYRPTCGNMLAGVGPAAIEMGLVTANADQTLVKIRAVNTGARVESIVQTPGGLVQYDGIQTLNGVPGTAAPIQLHFMDTVGSICGSMLPTGNSREVIENIEVTCMDVAMPMMIARANDFGISGYESPGELDANSALLTHLENIRLQAGQRMGLGDVSKSVVPKIGLIAPAHHGAAVSVRYFMPWNCHPGLAVTGSQCLAACLLYPDTVAEGIASVPQENPAIVIIEHPAGESIVTVSRRGKGKQQQIVSAGITSTARLLVRGEVAVPDTVW